MREKQVGNEQMVEKRKSELESFVRKARDTS